MVLAGWAIAASVGAGAAGVGAGVHGAVNAKEANDTIESAQSRHKKNIAKFENASRRTNRIMDNLGTFELKILRGFEEFSNTIERIQNRPDFAEYKKANIELPKYNKEELENVSVGAGVLLGALGGAVAGTAGAFAASGATTAAVMALGTASTGTAIASLSGAAATNATLAALGGGAIAAGGGGIALGTTVLGAATLGVGLLVGGLIFNITGNKLSQQADEAWAQMKKAEDNVEKICQYLAELDETAKAYTNALRAANNKYLLYFKKVSHAVYVQNKTDWNMFTEEEKIATQNTVLLVGVLYKMCKVELVKRAKSEEEMNTINHKEIDKTKQDVELVMKEFII